MVYMIFNHQLKMIGSNVDDLLKRKEAAPLRAFLEHKAEVYYAIVVGFWVALILWIWVHRQRGYGSRFLREFKAGSVSAVQYCIHDGGIFNYCCMRTRLAKM